MLVVDRFWSYVDSSKECWTWTAYKNKDKYGVFAIDRIPHYAHRVSWMIHNGEIPDGLCVLHKCDNPPCVRPDHLFLGTRKDNNVDKSLKGRASVAEWMKNQQGEKNINYKISDSQVSEIKNLRKEGKTLKEIASKYDISFQHVSKICNNERRGDYNSGR